MQLYDEKSVKKILDDFSKLIMEADNFPREKDPDDYREFWSGLSDADRETYWKDKDKLIGQVVEVRADQITQNQNAKDEWSLRFPRFLRFRGFKVGEKL